MPALFGIFLSVSRTIDKKDLQSDKIKKQKVTSLVLFIICSPSKTRMKIKKETRDRRLVHQATAHLETNTTNNILFMAPYAMPGINAGGSPGVTSNRFKYKGIDQQFNFSDWSNSIQSFAGGINDVKDYINGDKPLIQRVGPKSYFDTSKKFEYR